MQSLTALNHSHENLIVINDETHQSVVRSVPVDTFAPIQETHAPNFSMSTFESSPKGEIQLIQSVKHINPKVIFKGLSRASQWVQMVGNPDFTLGNRVVCEVRDKSPSPRIAAYNETNINGGTYYIAHRSAGALGHRTFENTHVNMVFGVCLFDNESVYLVNRNQKYCFLDMKNRDLHEIRIDEIRIDQDWTLYETELITRLSRCLADTALTLNQQTTLTIKYNIPMVEYYCYLLQNFDAGNISSACLEQWFDAVDERHQRVAQASIKQIQKRVMPLSVEIVPANSFSDLGSLIRHYIVHGKMPPLQEAMTLLAKKYPLWSQMMKHYTPVNFVDLTRLSYAYEYLAAGMSSHKPSETMCLAVEAYHETRILDHASSFMKTLPPNAVYVHAMYPMRQVALYATGDNTVAVDLYKNRPHPQMKDLQGNSIDVKIEFLKRFNQS
ncbi:hypothetical protein WDW89_20055 [Deltaproteobacteria bacterium TL4]